MNHREKEGRYEGKRQRRDEGRRQRRKEGRKMRSFREESEGREKEIRGREGYALSLQMSIQIVIDKEENIKVHCSYPNRLNINGRFDLAELSHHIIKEINANEINKSNLFDSLSLSLSLLLSFFLSLFFNFSLHSFFRSLLLSFGLYQYYHHWRERRRMCDSIGGNLKEVSFFPLPLYSSVLTT